MVKKLKTVLKRVLFTKMKNDSTTQNNVLIIICKKTAKTTQKSEKINQTPYIATSI